MLDIRRNLSQLRSNQSCTRIGCDLIATSSRIYTSPRVSRLEYRLPSIRNRAQNTRSERKECGHGRAETESTGPTDSYVQRPLLTLKFRGPIHLLTDGGNLGVVRRADANLQAQQFVLHQSLQQFDAFGEPGGCH